MRRSLVDRVSYINRFVQDNVCLQNSMSKLSPVLLKPISFFEISSSFSSDSGKRKASKEKPIESAAAKEARLKMVADLRRQYEKKTSIVRKKYAAEWQEKRLQEKIAQDELRKQIDEQKRVRAIEKKERATARAIEVVEEARILQHALKQQRNVSAAHKARMEGRQGYIRFRRMEMLRRQSSMWIEGKDLERRILEAIANPYHLAGSTGSEPSARDDSYYEADEQ